MTDRKREFYQYMMATKAIHTLGDISRDKPDLCCVYSEDEENYYGAWEAGFGFVKVQFPKSTTRPLTDEEADYYAGRSVGIRGQPRYIYRREELTGRHLVDEEI